MTGVSRCMSPGTWALIRSRFREWCADNPDADLDARIAALRDVVMNTLKPADVEDYLCRAVAEALGLAQGGPGPAADAWQMLEEGTLEDPPVRALLMDLNRRVEELEDK